MVSRPQLKSDANYVNGLAAAVLFVVLVAVFLTAGFDAPTGFAEDSSLVAGIGYALMDLQAMSPENVEGFLMTFEIVGVVLVAAVVGAVTLATRDTESDNSSRTLTDGGSEEPRSSDASNREEVEH